MTRVSISELKAKLSSYLREVRRGGEVQVMDRGVPVARLVPIEARSEADPERRARLESAGVLRRGGGDALSALPGTPIKVTTSILAALAEERADRL